MSGRVLIVEADDDPIVKSGSRDTLKSLYPGAAVHTFEDTGHMAALLRPVEYAEVIREFLDPGRDGRGQCI